MNNDKRMARYFLIKVLERQNRKWELFGVFYPDQEQWTREGWMTPDAYIRRNNREIERLKKTPPVAPENDWYLVHYFGEG